MDSCGRDDHFFCSLLDFGLKTEVMTFREPVLLLRSENIFGPLAWLQSRRQSNRLRGPKFEIKQHRSRCLLKSKLVDWGGEACRLGKPDPPWRWPCIALNCTPPPSNSWARPCWAMSRVSAHSSYAPELSNLKLVMLIR